MDNRSTNARVPKDTPKPMTENSQVETNHQQRRREWVESAQGDADSIPTLEEYYELAVSRRVVRGFRSDPIPEDVLHGVLEAANWAPSGANSQPWYFVVVQDEDIRAEMANIFRDEIRYKNEIDPEWPGAGNSREFLDAPATIVIAGDTRKERLWPQILDGSREKLFQHSLAACVMSLHLAAASTGLCATWVTTRRPTEHRLRKLLNLPDWMRVASTAPIGYPDLEHVPTEKHRIPVDEKIHYDKLDREKVPDLDELAAELDNWRERVYRPDLEE